MAPHEATRWTVRNRDSFEYLFSHTGLQHRLHNLSCVGLTTTTGGVTQGWEASVARCTTTKPVVTEFFVIGIARARDTMLTPRVPVTRSDGHKDIYSKSSTYLHTNW